MSDSIRTDSPSIWSNPPRGFRMMWWDPIAIATCIAGTFLAWPYLREWSLVAPYVLANFFLFCNVFRVRRNAELVWAATFLANALLWLTMWLSVTGLLATQTIATIAVIAHAWRSPGYRGVWASALSRER